MYDAIDAGYRYVSSFAFPRAGKSFGAARAVEPFLMFEDIHCGIIAPTYALGSKEFGYCFTDFNELGILKMADSASNTVHSGNMHIHFPWGSFLQVISADNITALRGEEWDILILAEAAALGEDVYERHLFARTERRHGLVLVPTTPKGYNWLYESFRVPSLRTINGLDNPRYDPAYWSVVVSSVPDMGDILEPTVYDQDTIDRARRILPEQVFKEQFGGDFASYAGLIYHYDPLKHEAPSDTVIPDDWTHIVGYDHGSTEHDPTAVVFGSYAPDGTLYWWDEIYVHGKSAAEYAGMIRHKLGTKRPSAIVVDPHAKQVRIELSRVELYTTIPHDKMIEARLTKVTSLMNAGKWKVVKGRCPHLIKEMHAYEWDEDNPGKVRNGQMDHALDAMGYACLAEVYVPPVKEETLVPQSPTMTPLQAYKHKQLWEPWYRTCKERDDQRAAMEVEDVLLDDPFSEDRSGRPKPYQPAGV